MSQKNVRNKREAIILNDGSSCDVCGQSCDPMAPIEQRKWSRVTYQISNEEIVQIECPECVISIKNRYKSTKIKN